MEVELRLLTAVRGKGQVFRVINRDDNVTC